MSDEWNEQDWGAYGSEPPCEHLIALRNTLADLGLAVWSEHGTEPSGWVNISCDDCHRTYETVLHDDHDPLKRKP